MVRNRASPLPACRSFHRPHPATQAAEPRTAALRKSLREIGLCPKGGSLGFLKHSAVSRIKCHLRIHSWPLRTSVRQVSSGWQDQKPPRESRGRILILPPERGHSCPQQRWKSTSGQPTSRGIRTLLRTGMSALRPGWQCQDAPESRRRVSMAIGNRLRAVCRRSDCGRLDRGGNHAGNYYSCRWL